LTEASPTTLRIAARIEAGVADAGLIASDKPNPAAPASAAVSIRKRRRVAGAM
jgi:hypothetical protein